MKKNQINAILPEQTERRGHVLSFVFVIIIIAVLAVAFFFLYSEKNKSYYVNYNEKSNIDYKVYLKDNEFFDDVYLAEEHQYIATLIDYINADFNYELSLEEDVEYKYSYRVETNVNVKSKTTNNPLYDKTKVTKTSDEEYTDNRTLTIAENVKIDYNEYNDLIKKFIKIYDLEDIESTLTINLYVNVIGACEDFDENQKRESVMSLSIPLTTQTVAIELSDDLINTENNVMQCKKTNISAVLFMILAIVFVITDIVLIVITVRYVVKTRTAESIYEKELKKILNNYGSYIQTLNSEFDFSDYQPLRLDTFDDMLEIRDTIRQPILMKENNNRTGAYFVIPSSTKILYVYRMKVSDIKKELDKKVEPEIEEI